MSWLECKFSAEFLTRFSIDDVDNASIEYLITAVQIIQIFIVNW